MRNVIVGAFVSLDGVMQAPGGPDEDKESGFEHGGWVESCSDMFFGSRNNLIKPGPSRTMADG